MFKVEITSIHDFLIFVNIIRNKDLNDVETRQFIETLNKSNDKVEEAVTNANTSQS